MPGIKELIKNGPVHERRIEMHTYPLDDGRVVVEGRLHDERLVVGYHWNGSPSEPGVVHDLVVRLLVGNFPLEIMDAEAEMPGTPHEECITTRDSVKRLIGLNIISGFSEKVRELIGGTNGCTHLTTLVVSMGPAALHGFWTHMSRKPQPIPKSFDDIAGLQYLINSCALWAEDGVFIKMMKKEMDKAREE